MADITITWSPADGRGDWTFAPGGDLDTGDDLATAILLSLFTDRPALKDDVIPDGTADRRGWWGDRELGSRLWLLERAKQTTETLHRARDYIAEALQWLVDDGVVARFDIEAAWLRRSTLGARITAFRSDGRTVALSYSWAWGA
ncbi:phage GP46 family protein [Azospirillum sp. TSH64]|uniref:phage GP46 family protein n=1 Tax=Azospirillum sp. TSH64 TaxID=652740 RepID=UPI000D61CC68|nr:phage GP46 family protein [Azospirillum sp. TSH64]PWC74062.1 hypothetical protein TSH64_02665 [Azospirillum sp. TSH64]